MRDLIFGVIGGTSLLMYGVDKMGDGLEKASGDTMKKIISVVTGNVLLSFLVGIFVTALVQSSTAVTVLTVGFVNSGLLELTQAIGIIYGANIGTTITAQLMSVSFNFNLTDFALPIIGFGFVLGKLFKKEKVQSIGQAFMGFGMMFLGLKILNSGVPYMEQSQALRLFFAKYASNPIIAISLGAFVTAMVHSSAATMAIIMILSEAGLLGLETAVYIILGENLGTCITAQLASNGGNINARRTAWAHTLYNVFGSMLAVIFFPFFISIVKKFTFLIYGDASNISNHLANAHTLFNTINALIFLPLTGLYVKFLETVIKPREDQDESIKYLDPLFLDTPAVALEASRKEIGRCADILRSMLENSMSLIETQDIIYKEKIDKQEIKVNDIQKYLTKYIVNISSKELSDRQSITVPAMVSSISYLERAADRVFDMTRLIVKQNKGEAHFSDVAYREVLELDKLLLEMINITRESLDGNYRNVKKSLELREEIEEAIENFQSSHINRLSTGACHVDSGVLFMDIISNIERAANNLRKTIDLSSTELIGIKSKTD